MRGEAQYWRAPPAQAEPDLAVEERGARRRGGAGFGDEQLKFRRGEVSADDAVTMVVNEHEFTEIAEITEITEITRATSLARGSRRHRGHRGHRSGAGRGSACSTDRRETARVSAT